MILDNSYLNQIEVNIYVFYPSILWIGLQEVRNSVQVGCYDLLHLRVFADLTQKFSNGVSKLSEK